MSEKIEKNVNVKNMSKSLKVYVALKNGLSFICDKFFDVVEKIEEVSEFAAMVFFILCFGVIFCSLTAACVGFVIVGFDVFSFENFEFLIYFFGGSFLVLFLFVLVKCWVVNCEARLVELSEKETCGGVD